MESSDKTNYLPLFFNIKSQPCLIVGGGDVALRKVRQLLRSGARITIIAPEVAPELSDIISSGGCEWMRRDYRSPEASTYSLVIATTNNSTVNRQVYDDCQSLGIPVNVVDQPDLCSVIFPSVINRGLITLAISSGGRVPFLTKALREKLEIFLDSIELLENPEILIKFREFVKSKTDNFNLKKKMYRRLMNYAEEEALQWSPDHPPYDLWSNWLKEEDA